MTNILTVENKVNLLTVYRGEKGDRGGTTSTRTLAYESSGLYTLSDTPSNTSSILLFINGAKQSQGIDFNVNGTILNWVSSSLNLSNTDLIEVIY